MEIVKISIKILAQNFQMNLKENLNRIVAQEIKKIPMIVIQ